jgi:hypothetical protein
MPHGDWPEDAFPNSPFAAGRRVTHGFDDRSRSVVLALVPTPRSWEVPAYLEFGGWNANPPPVEHVAVHRNWHEQYGAQLVAMQFDVLEMMVARPPKTRQAALRLARDQYHYCEDIVEQGTRTLEQLASGLLRGESWFFWWD